MNEEKKKVAAGPEQGQQDETSQPDRLDELLADVPEWLRGPLKENWKQILVSLVLVILAVSLWSGYSYYRIRQAQAASYHLGIAMSKTDVNDRIKELKDLMSRFSHTDAARLAKLLLAQAYMENGDWTNARQAYQDCVSDFKGVLADSATMGHGYASEELKDLAQALADFEKVGSGNSGFEAVALLDKARILVEEGKKKDALDAYGKYLDLKPESPFLDFIRYEILRLS